MKLPECTHLCTVLVSIAENCGWVEDPQDNLDWVTANSKKIQLQSFLLSNYFYTVYNEYILYNLQTRARKKLKTFITIKYHGDT